MDANRKYVGKDGSVVSRGGAETGIKEFIEAKFRSIENKLALQAQMLREQGERQEAASEDLKRKIDEQSEQIRLLRQTFDRIMLDYFGRLVSSLDELNKMIEEGVEAQDLYDAITRVKERVAAVTPGTAVMAGEEMRRAYEDIVPSITKRIDEMEERVAKELEGIRYQNHREVMFRAEEGIKLTDNLGSFVGKTSAQIMNLIDKRFKELATRIDTVNGRVGRVEEASRPLGSRNRYRM